MRIALRPKMMLGVLGPLAIVLALFAYIQYNTERSLLLTSTIHTATDINDVIKGSLQYDMLTRNRAGIQTTLDDIGSNAQVIDLFLLNRKSQIRAGIPRSNLGQQRSKTDAGCAACHTPGAPHAGEFSAVLTLPDIGTVLRSCMPIENKEACHKCHDPAQPYNGVLITDLSLAKVEQQANSNLQHTVLLLSGALLLGAALLGVTMERSVVQPLSHLARVISEFDRGNLRRRVEPTAGGDEIEALGQTFNQMADGIEEKFRLEDQLHDHAQELERLYAALQEKEAMRAQLLKQAIMAQEDERARLSRELHDEIGQMLTAVQLGLDRFDRSLPVEDAAARERLDRVRSLTEQTLADVRRVIAALRPGVLDQLGLAPALGWVADHTLRPLGIDVTIETTGLADRLPGELEITLFRVAQEAMNNVARHSRAGHLTIRLAQAGDQVTMTLADDGVGFTAAELTAAKGGEEQSRGLGLAGMQERAFLAGGQVTVNSVPGRGTTIQVIVPVPALPGPARATESGQMS